MKLKYIAKGIVPVVVTMLSLSSCLKDDRLDQDFSEINKSFIGVYDDSPSSSTNNSTGYGMVSSDATAIVNLEVGYLGQGVSAGSDITLEYDPKVLEEYNAATGSHYELLNVGDFIIPASVNIPAGSKSVKYPITLKPNVIIQSDADAEKLYAMPVRVTKGPEAISGNFGKHVILISVKNQYDGKYSLDGSIIRNSAGGPDPVLGGTYAGLKATLITRNTTSVWFNKQVWRDGSTAGGIGNPEVDGVIFTVDPVTNKVTVTCPAQSSLKNTPGFDSRWDPATKSFHVAFEWGNAPGTRVVVNTLVRTGDR